MTHFLAGIRHTFALFSIVLVATFIGIGALCKELGFSLAFSMVAAGAIWAGPAQVILISGASAGVGILPLALTIGLSSVRMMPMVVSLMPLFRAGKHNTFKLLIASHIVSISTWAEGLKILPPMPAEHRLPFFYGIGVSVIINSMLATMVGYMIAGVIPKPLLGGMLFLTPIFFLLTLLKAVKARGDYAAIGFGLVLLLTLQPLLPNLAMLIAGVGGGTLAFLVRKRL
jgi:predicted branched-subunit amino acid permease